MGSSREKLRRTDPETRNWRTITRHGLRVDVLDWTIVARHVNSLALSKTVKALHDGVARDDCRHKGPEQGGSDLHFSSMEFFQKS